MFSGLVGLFWYTKYLLIHLQDQGFKVSSIAGNVRFFMGFRRKYYLLLFFFDTIDHL